MRGMKPPRRRTLLHLSLLLASVGLSPAAMARPARRIVSVGGALTEIAYALGCEEELVGVDTTSLYPPAAASLPNVGYARALSAEGVLALAPTNVVATEEAGPPAVLRQIAGAGVPVTVLASDHRFEGMLERVRKMGGLTGREERAAQLVSSLQREWKEVRAGIDGRKSDGTEKKAPRVLFILAHSPNQIMVAGEQTAADAMIRYVGAVNAISGFRGFKPMTPEAAIAAQPDVILLTEQGLKTNGGAAGILKLPGLGQTPAGQAQRIVALEAMFLLGFGPRLPKAVAELDAALLASLAGKRRA